MSAYRVVDLAGRWKCSPNTVRGMIRRGELKPLPFCGRLLRISEEEVTRWESGSAASEGTGESAPADRARRSKP